MILHPCNYVHWFIFFFDNSAAHKKMIGGIITQSGTRKGVGIEAGGDVDVGEAERVQ
jgi:hypothetical protein